MFIIIGLAILAWGLIKASELREEEEYMRAMLEKESIVHEHKTLNVQNNYQGEGMEVNEHFGLKDGSVVDITEERE